MGGADRRWSALSKRFTDEPDALFQLLERREGESQAEASNPGPGEARQSMARHFRFYKFERPHQALDYRTPADLYYRTSGCSCAHPQKGGVHHILRSFRV